MSAPRDPDTILAAWLEEGPNELPDATRRAIAVTTRTTRQTRRAIGVPWRINPMSPIPRLAVAAVVTVAVLGGALYLLSPGGQGVGGTPPTTSPSVTSAPSSAPPSPASEPPSPAPQGTIPTEWTFYTSSRFAYSIDYPADWVATPATRDWPSDGWPFPDGTSVDKFGLTPTSTRVLVSSVPLKAGEVAAERIAGLDSINAPICRLSDRHDITIDGVTARQEDFFCFSKDYGIEVAVVNAGRFYQLDLFSQTPIGETDRATFDRFLASFRFGG